MYLKSFDSLYPTWQNIKQECYNYDNHSYHNYGAKGIGVCKRWLHSFNDFKNDMGERPSKKHVIDRIDETKDFTPNNCRWVTREEQQKYRKENSKYVFKGKKRTLQEISKITNLSIKSLWYGLNRGYKMSEIPHKLSKKLFLYKNKKRTLKEISDMVGINYVTLRVRIYKYKLSLEQALNLPKYNNYKVYTHNGDRISVKDISKNTDVPYTTILYRLSKGMSLEDAIINTKKFFIYEGKELSLKDISKKINIPYSTLRHRIYKQGMSLEDAINK